MTRLHESLVTFASSGATGTWSHYSLPMPERNPCEPLDRLAQMV
jgi:hypothetical protein